MKKVLLMFVLSSMLFGCIVVSQNMREQQLSGIRRGMSKDEVISELGNPSQTKKMIMGRQEYEVWKYPLERKWAKRFNAMGDYYYQILFLDEKVQRWDFIKAFAQPAYDYQEPDSTDKASATIQFLK